jgi:misacylated tRNA(Ala) deacylase
MTEEIFRDDAYAVRCTATITAIDADGITLDRTVFYPQSGGQPGDTGVLRRADGAGIAIIDTTPGNRHIPAEGTPPVSVGEAVEAEIDWPRRYRLMRMHSCLHLLCAVVTGDVTGGQIGETRGRLDFNLPDTALDKAEITAALNQLIAADHRIAARWITEDALAAQPDLVRTMSVSPPAGQGRVRLLEIEGVDLQPCGGTHVRRTGEIGRVAVAKIENKGRRNRRINIVFAEE